VQLYLIRHGQSYVNLSDWTQGNTDEGLTELGQRQAQRLGAWLPQHLPSVDALYASTMLRARETAAAIVSRYDVTVQFDDRLREIGNSRIDHTPWLPNQFADHWASARPFSPIVTYMEGGESFMNFRTRIGLFVETILERHHNQRVLVVCHGGVVEAVFDHIFNIGPWRRCEIWDHNTAITHFEYVEHPGREVWRLHYHNRTEHLVGLDRA
jgi:2,3-bisphosphoglycerate-dependent phosphoglycerate mutase